MILTAGIVPWTLLVLSANEIQGLFNATEWTQTSTNLLVLPGIPIFTGVAAARGEKIIREELFPILQSA